MIKTVISNINVIFRLLYKNAAYASTHLFPVKKSNTLTAEYTTVGLIIFGHDSLSSLSNTLLTFSHEIAILVEVI